MLSVAAPGLFAIKSAFFGRVLYGLEALPALLNPVAVRRRGGPSQKGTLEVWGVGFKLADESAVVQHLHSIGDMGDFVCLAIDAELAPDGNDLGLVHRSRPARAGELIMVQCRGAGPISSDWWQC